MATVLTERTPPNPLDSLGSALERDGQWMVGSVVVAACLHLALPFVLPRRAPAPRRAAAAIVIVDVETAPPPPPPERDEPPVPAAPAEVPRSTAPRREAAPSPAQAAKVLARDEHADDPADLTGAFVTGNAAFYAGGTTSAAGTSTRVVREASGAGAAAGKGSGGAGGGVAPSTGPDRSRGASMEGGSTWHCPFPAEADDVNDAAVPMRVELDASGKVLHAAVLRDPGHGFGREAERCVQDKRWSSALDREGTPIAASAVIVVRFVR